MNRLLGLLLLMGMVGCPSCPHLDSFVRYSTGTRKKGKSFSDRRKDELVTKWVRSKGHTLKPNTEFAAAATTAAADPTAVLKELGARFRLDASGAVVTVDFLHNEKISDAGLVHLKGLNKLQALNLSFTNVTDAGLIHLRELTKLKSLYLVNYQFSDTGLVHLKKLANLSFLDLSETQVTDAGVAELQQALPNCEIRKPNGKINN